MAETVCIFRYETAAFTQVYPEALHELHLSNLRKLFKFMCSDRDINSVPIRVTHDALKDLIYLRRIACGALPRQSIRMAGLTLGTNLRLSNERSRQAITSCSER